MSKKNEPTRSTDSPLLAPVAVPTLWDTVTIRSLQLRNRIVMSPMCQYQAGGDGCPTEWHFVHYGSRAAGGAGLIIVEATAVTPGGRISPNDLGLWSDNQIEPFARLVAFCHRLHTAVGVQLGHAGRKASPQLPEQPVCASALRFSSHYKVPRALSPEEIAGVVDAFAAAARRAVRAGFDLIEIHAAHGYLIHQFLSPATNQRTDAYGGSPAARTRLLQEVITAVRSVIPSTMPLFVRVSAAEYLPDGYTPHELGEQLRPLLGLGVDLIDVSSGGNGPARPPVYPGYQVPLALALHQQLGVPVQAVGRLEEPALAAAVVGSSQVELVAIGRGFLRDPHWPLTAARALASRTPEPRALALVPPAYQRISELD